MDASIGGAGDNNERPHTGNTGKRTCNSRSRTRNSRPCVRNSRTCSCNWRYKQYYVQYVHAIKQPAKKNTCINILKHKKNLLTNNYAWFKSHTRSKITHGRCTHRASHHLHARYAYMHDTMHAHNKWGAKPWNAFDESHNYNDPFSTWALVASLIKTHV